MKPPRWYAFPLYAWALPNTLIGLLLCATFYRAHSWRWSQGCLECVSERIWGRPIGQTWGWLIVYRSTTERDTRRDIRVHERVHVWQGLVLGPLFLVAYAGHFLLALPFHFPPADLTDGRDGPWWYETYRDVWAEKQACRIQREYQRRPGGGEWGG